LDTQSTLSIAAEVGIGVAGFASIATAVLSRARADEFEVRWVQVRTLLVTSLAVVVLSYLPMALGASSLSEESIWFFGSGVYATWVLVTLLVYLGGYRTLRSQPGHKRFLANLVLLLALTSLTLNGFNIAFIRDDWPYLAALGCGILVTFSQFVSLVRSFWDSDEQNDG
jgi:hypothetical protein